MAKIITPTDEHQKALQWCIYKNIDLASKKFEVITDNLPF